MGFPARTPPPGGVKIGEGLVRAEDLRVSLAATGEGTLSGVADTGVAKDLDLGSGSDDTSTSGFEIEMRDVGGHTVARNPGGFFVMGSVLSKNAPPHGVYLSPFEYFVTNVSEGQYRRFMEAGGRDKSFPDHPVTKVYYEQAAAYLQRISELTGERVELPTEAQDEFVTRGRPVEIHEAMEREWGTYNERRVAQFVKDRFENFVATLAMGTRIFTDTTDRAFRELAAGAAPFYGWRIHGTRSGGTPTPEETWIGRSELADVNWGEPNDYGVLQVLGNVWRWVKDWYHPDTYLFQNHDPEGPVAGIERLTRGAAHFVLTGEALRASFRNPTPPSASYGLALGFRGVVLPKNPPR